jgi:hypothetical protein
MTLSGQKLLIIITLRLTSVPDAVDQVQHIILDQEIVDHHYAVDYH